MSIFQDRTVACPHCRVETVRSVAASLHAPRVPAIRQAILEDRFQQFACPACHQTYVVEGPFIYIDFEARRWIGVYPAAWERSWRALEQEALASWRTTMLEHAPPMVQRMAEGFVVRAVFGLTALRDKLVCLDADFDDHLLEVFKIDLMRSLPELAFHPGGRPALKRVDDRLLTFTAADGERPGGDLELIVERRGLDALAAEKESWASALTAVSGGPYVDVGRILIGGDAVTEAGDRDRVSARAS